MIVLDVQFIHKITFYLVEFGLVDHYIPDDDAWNF